MTPENEPPLDFEDALRQLEQVVDDLERGEPGLSAALAKYGQGVRLLARCHGILDQAERSVALLTGMDGEGNPLTAPFDATATAGRDPAPEPAPSPRKRPPSPAADGDDALTPF